MGLKPIRFPGINPVSQQHAQLVSHALETVEELLRRRMALGVRKSSMSVDAACELAVNVAQLRRAATPLLGEARDFILAHRNEDGSVGEFQWLEARNRVQKVEAASPVRQRRERGAFTPDDLLRIGQPAVECHHWRNTSLHGGVHVGAARHRVLWPS